MLAAIQYTAECRDAAEAAAMLDTLTRQVDYLGGRMLGDNGKPWRVQTFHDATGVEAGWLPDGCRRVLVPDALARALGINPEARR